MLLQVRNYEIRWRHIINHDSSYKMGGRERAKYRGSTVCTIDTPSFGFVRMCMADCVWKDNFSYDKENPRILYVTPPVSSTTAVYVEMQVSQLPTTVTASGDDPGINDVFFEPIVQYMLYKAFSADDEGVEFEKAISFMQNFFNLLQVEMTVSKAYGPETKE